MNGARWQRWWRRRRQDAAAILVVVLFFTLFFGWILCGHRVVIGGDAFVYCYPLRTVAWRMIKQGELPLWTPYIMSGYPLLSMAQLGIGYPLTWSYLFLPGYVAEQIYVLAPFLLAPIFTYTYVREIGRSRLAALLAGLSFGYGGMTTNLLGIIGMPNNSLIWLPLLLIPIERARTRRFVPCLLWATGAYALSILNGHGQSLLYVGMLAVAYAAYLSCASSAPETCAHDRVRRWLGWHRWRPLLVAIGALILASGVAAYQILETMRAFRQSIRSTLNFHAFISGYFPPSVALKSFIVPLYTPRFADVTTYAAPLVCVLAVVGCFSAWRWRVRDDLLRVGFWLGVAAVAAVLILGPVTPLYRALYHVPLLNLFRVPSRHVFEWSFALSVLAAYGWDACYRLNARRTAQQLSAHTRRAMIISLSALMLGAVAGLLWWHATAHAQVKTSTATSDPDPSALWYTGLAVSAYVWWKIALALLTLTALWQGWRVAAPRWRTGLLAGVVVLGCFVEPYIMVTNWWAGFAKSPARVETAAPLTRYLQQFPPEQNRVYTRIDLFVDENSPTPRVDALDLTARYGLHNVAGYEPLLLERYSRALGNVRLDSVNPLPGYQPYDALLATDSHVLDLLNTTFVASFPNLHTSPTALPERNGIKFDLSEAGREIKPAATEPVAITDTTADYLALITSLANAADIVQDAPVARVRVLTADGQQIERELRAGVDTAEWAHERPDLRLTVKHALAPLFDRQMGDLNNSYQACRYLAQISLGARIRVKRIEIVNLSDHATLALWAASLHDTATGQSQSLSRKLLYLQLDAGRWQAERGVDGLQILHNTRALPRAWLVTEAEAVDSEEALRRIRGEGTIKFDPRRTALLEVRPTELPPLPGGDVRPESTARITSYEPNHLVIETSAPTTTVLVVSEIFYPGWAASVDGQPTSINATDYLLRGVALPAGPHKVEMRYTAPAARNGAIISALTLLVLCALAVNARRQGKNGMQV
jgi:Bacterial membrane protein YfhO